MRLLPTFKDRCHCQHGLWLIAYAMLAMVGCSGGGGVQRFPTALPSPVVNSGPSADFAALGTPAPPDLTPTPLSTIEPLLDLPEAGQIISCEANTLRLPAIRRDGLRTGVISRIDASDAWLFVLADGSLFGIKRLNADAGLAELEPMLLREQQVAGRPVQELVDLYVDRAGGFVFVLDKAGHVFKVDIITLIPSIAYRVSLVDDDDLDPNFLAITPDESGRLILLDTSQGVLWTPQGIQERIKVGESRGLTSGADVAEAEGKYYVLRQDGAILLLENAVGSSLWQEAEGRRLTLTLRRSDHLGAPLLYAVDALRREISGILPESGELVARHSFNFPDMGLLRDVVFEAGRMYAVADADLYVYPGPGGAAAPVRCDQPVLANFARPMLYGEDVLGMTRGLRYPINQGTLPVFTRLYPGAPRLYRSGVHEGLDIYGINAPDDFDIGYPVVAAAAGEIIQATVLYVAMDEEEFDVMLAQAEGVGSTPAEIRTRLAGRQIIIDHGNGVQTVYQHLDSIEPGIVTGARVRAGQIIGAVGVTGTSGEFKPGSSGPHLHFEIRIGEHYLGQGLTIPETMWWWDQIFGTLETAPN